jgi:hypothetical protein
MDGLRRELSREEPSRLLLLGIKYGAGKASHPHYLPLYERYLAGREVHTILELGVEKGGSLRMWREYFPGATVAGVDDTHTGPEVLPWDQADPRLATLGPFDLIVDDASHDPRKTADSLRLLWPRLNPGGLYTVEDLEVGYWPGHKGSLSSREGIVGMLKGLEDGLTARYANQEPGRFPHLTGLEAVHRHPNIAFLEKEL